MFMNQQDVCYPSSQGLCTNRVVFHCFCPQLIIKPYLGGIFGNFILEILVNIPSSFTRMHIGDNHDNQHAMAHRRYLYSCSHFF